jgi:zinc D-Ala-D-Ala carboxypeptidase
MIDNIQFTKNFSLYELLQSQQASRLSFDEQFNPSETTVDNLKLLCINILQPLRDAIKIPITISSGYRCFRLNTIIGGASKSQHLTGHAADIQCFKIGNEELLKRIAALKLPFDQMINEFNYAWVHVSYDSNRIRGQMLEAVKDKNMKTFYRTIV